MGGGESDSFFGYFFKYLYMFVIIQTVFLSLFYKTRFKNTIYPPGTRLFKILTFCFYASLITSVIFSVYFANYYFLSTGDLDSILALLVLLHWFVFAGKKIITNHNNPDRLFLTSITSIIYFLPFIIGGLITCFKKYSFARENFLIE